MKMDDYVDPGFSPKVFEGHNLYVLVWHGPKVVAARKIYKNLPGQKDHMNKWLKEKGLPTISGNLYVSAYIGVDPDYRRQGLGLKMHDAVAEMMDVGDVLQFGSHEPEGAQLTSAWLRRHPEFNVIFAEGGRYLEYNHYNPKKKNFVIKDRGSFPTTFDGV